jgi:hypothetical protein
MPPALDVHGPADLITAIPYLLGFHPHESVVVVGLHDGAVVVTIRVDLDQVVGTAQLADAIVAMQRAGASSYICLIFDDRADRSARFDEADLPWCGVVTEIVAAAIGAGGRLSDGLLVCRGRYWSYLCESNCCPAEGVRLADQSSSIAAAATYAGMVALPDRAAVGRLLDPRPADEREALRVVLDDAVGDYCGALADGTVERLDRSAKRAIFALARAAHSGADLPTAPDELARIGVAMRRIEVRDALWAAVDDGRLRGDRLWRHLASELPSPYDAAPLFLAGWHAWRKGEGALTRMAVERALASDPAYSAADLLGAAINAAVDPRRFPRIRNRRRPA